MKNILKSLVITCGTSTLFATPALVKQDANLRVSPNLKSAIVRIIKQNENVNVIKKVYTKDQGVWYKTDYGYISQELLDTHKYNKYKITNQNYVDASKLSKKPAVFLDNNVVFTEVILTKTPPVVKVSKDANLVSKEAFQPKVETINNKATPTQTKYFAAVLLGLNSLDVNKKDISGSIVLNDKLDNSGTSYVIQGGIIEDKYLLSINYEAVNLSDVSIKSTYLSLDYKFPYYLNPYLGLSVGISDLTWKIDPLVSSSTKDNKLSSRLYGIQTGISYPLRDNWSIYSQLSYQKFNFKTKLISSPAQAEITQESKSFLGLGVRKEF